MALTKADQSYVSECHAILNLVYREAREYFVNVGRGWVPEYDSKEISFANFNINDPIFDCDDIVYICVLRFTFGILKNLHFPYTTNVPIRLSQEFEAEETKKHLHDAHKFPYPLCIIIMEYASEFIRINDEDLIMLAHMAYHQKILISHPQPTRECRENFENHIGHCARCRKHNDGKEYEGDDGEDDGEVDENGKDKYVCRDWYWRANQKDCVWEFSFGRSRCSCRDRKYVWDDAEYSRNCWISHYHVTFDKYKNSDAAGIEILGGLKPA